MAEEAGLDPRILNTVMEVNYERRKIAIKHTEAMVGGSLKGKTIGLLGLAFKPNTDDMREATSRQVIKDLLSAGATVTAYDPVAMPEAQHCLAGMAGLSYAANQGAALQNADALVIVTEWKEFRSPDFPSLKAALKSPVIFDGRNLYDPKLVRGMGFEYLAIGR